MLPLYRCVVWKAPVISALRVRQVAAPSTPSPPNGYSGRMSWNMRRPIRASYSAVVMKLMRAMQDAGSVSVAA